MNRIHRIHRSGRVLAGLFAAATAALAVGGSMPGWQITLIAIGTALLVAAVALLIDRARIARRRSTATVI